LDTCDCQPFELSAPIETGTIEIGRETLKGHANPKYPLKIAIAITIEL
jgi:hypothetical protein